MNKFITSKILVSRFMNHDSRSLIPCVLSNSYLNRLKFNFDELSEYLLDVKTALVSVYNAFFTKHERNEKLLNFRGSLFLFTSLEKQRSKSTLLGQTRNEKVIWVIHA